MQGEIVASVKTLNAIPSNNLIWFNKEIVFDEAFGKKRNRYVSKMNDRKGREYEKKL